MDRGADTAPVVGRPDCCIVGGGPAALLLAGLLGRAGWSVTVLERQATPRRTPAGVVLQPGTLGLLADVGLLDAVRPLGATITAFEEKRDGARVFHHAYAGLPDSPVPYALTVPLASLRELLTRFATEHPRVTLVLGADVGDVRRVDGRRYALTARTPAGDHTFAPTTIVAADGKFSRVRAQVDIPTSVDEHATRHLLVRGALPAGWPAALRCWSGTPFVFAAPGQDGRIHLLCGVDGAAADALRQEPFGELRRMLADADPALGDLDLEASDWAQVPTITYHAVHASAWHAANVVLLGDSAHALPSFGGQGMNLALQDASLLAEVLHRCLSSREVDHLGRFGFMRKRYVDDLQRRLALAWAAADDDPHRSRYAALHTELALGQPDLRPWTVGAIRHSWTF